MTATDRIELDLQMQPCTAAQGEASAWFVAGDSPRRWLDELCDWGVPLASMRLFAVPRSRSDNTPQGVLVVTEAPPKQAVHATPYRRLGERLFLPVHARLVPDLWADELSAALRYPVNILHPSAGLFAYEPADVLGVADLLVVDPPLRSDWGVAAEGPRLNDRLRSVQADAAVGFEQLLQQMQDDIGGQAGDDVPASPDESKVKDAAKTAATKVTLPIMKALLILLSIGSGAGRPVKPAKKSGELIPPQPPRPPGRLRQWAQRHVEKMTAELEAHRFRELQRLTDLMQRDPDEALKYALPLSGIAGRGVAPPTGRLGPRPTDFNLSKLFGGNRPTDSWRVPDDMRRTLLSQYRAAANRELNLQRYRRAAYIFAHLLGDHAAAASALARGKHYRDAAVLYRDKLNNPKAAADCLADGGLLSEAIPIYTELNLHERAGDLHQQLCDAEQAETAYERALQQYKQRSDLLAAAALLERKLRSPEAALEFLETTWPHSDKAELCLKEWFKLAARLGRHDAARRRVEQLRDDEPPAHRYVPLVKLLSAVATTYPNPGVCARAADTTRVLAGNKLSSGGGMERETLVNAVIALAPQDRLLDRDGARFLNRQPKRPEPIALKFRAPKLVRSFRLLNDLQWRGAVWHQVAAIPRGFIALGVRDNHLLLVRGAWDARQQFTRAEHLNMPSKAYLLLSPTGKRPALFASLGDAAAPPGQLVIAADGPFDSELRVAHPPITGRSMLGMCGDENGNTWILHGADARDLALSFYDGDRILFSRELSLDFDLFEHLQKPVQMAARKGSVYIASGRHLVKEPRGMQPKVFDLPASVRRMTPSAPATRTRLICSFDEGGVIIDPLGHTRPFGSKLIAPAASFMPDGSLVAVGESHGQHYPRFAEQSSTPTPFEVTSRAPLAVLPANHDQFAVFDADGTVLVYMLPIG